MYHWFLIARYLAEYSRTMYVYREGGGKTNPKFLGIIVHRETMYPEYVTGFIVWPDNV